jgi:hypothetical protein
MSGAVVASVLYRIVKGDAPTERDFLSRMMLGFPARAIEQADPGEWAGLSLYDNPERARQTARDFPQIGSHVAAVSLVNIAPRRVVVRRTGGGGHHTVWAAPGTLLGAVTRVEAV